MSEVGAIPHEVSVLHRRRQTVYNQMEEQRRFSVIKCGCTFISISRH